jgi:CheY-like chemotaxis protein
VKDFCILQVEDSKDDIALLRYGFQGAGISNPLYAVHDGQEAMDYLNGEGRFADRQEYPFPGLVLLDLKLPRVPGLQLLKWIREQPQLKTLIVIILSSSNQETDVESAYRAGANAFLTKPSGIAQLVAFAEALKKFWLELNVTPPVGHVESLAP